MEKLQIAGMSGGGRYVKIKAFKGVMRVIRALFLELGDRSFEDMPESSIGFGNFSKWKDKRELLRTKEFDAMFIFGDKYVHIIITRGANLKKLHSVLDKFGVWLKPRLKKSVKKK